MLLGRAFPLPARRFPSPPPPIRSNVTPMSAGLAEGTIFAGRYRVFDAGFDAATSTPFLVMELLRGEELGQRLERYWRLPAADVVRYLHQTALALDKTHRASIVHRDLKPEDAPTVSVAGTAAPSDGATAEASARAEASAGGRD